MENKQFLVIGVGNPLLADDTAGLMTVEAAEKAWHKRNLSVHFKKYYSMGLDLLFDIPFYNKIIIVDSVYTGKAGPGFCHQISPEEITSFTQTSLASSHGLNLSSIFALGKKLNYTMPDEALILGIEGRNFETFAESPTSLVQKSIKSVVKKIILKLNQWINQ